MPDPAVRKIIEACVDRALAEAEQNGVTIGEFWEAMQAVRAENPDVPMTEMLKLTLDRTTRHRRN